MGFPRSADIFQAEMGNLMAALEYVRTYIDNLLIITKSSHDDHLGKLEQVFIRLCDARLKMNSAKFILLCTRDGILRIHPHQRPRVLEVIVIPTDYPVP